MAKGAFAKIAMETIDWAGGDLAAELHFVHLLSALENTGSEYTWLPRSLEPKK